MATEPRLQDPPDELMKDPWWNAIAEVQPKKVQSATERRSKYIITRDQWTFFLAVSLQFWDANQIFQLQSDMD